jgi:hypothetical protein
VPLRGKDRQRDLAQWTAIIDDHVHAAVILQIRNSHARAKWQGAACHRQPFGVERITARRAFTCKTLAVGGYESGFSQAHRGFLF